MVSFFVGACQIFSCLLVALGQNALYPWCGPLAASFAFAVHWKALDGLSKRQATIVSFLWFFVVSSLQLSWMTDTEYQGVYIFFVYLSVVFLCALQFSFLTKKIRDVSNLRWLNVLGLCSLWTLMEWIRLHFLCGFAFNFIGLSLSCHLFSLQLASLFGVLGLSFWVIMTNLVGLKFLRSPRSNFLLFGWVILIFIPYSFGLAHVTYQDYRKEKEGSKDHGVLLIQTGLLPSQKYKIKGREKDFIHPVQQWRMVLEKIVSEIREGVDLLVLPEAAFPFSFDLYVYDLELVNQVLIKALGEKVVDFLPAHTPPFAQEKLGKLKASNAYWAQALSNFFKAQVMIGLDTEKEEKNYNSAFFFEPGSLPKRYDKRVLLPLAEYIPFEVLRKLSQKYGIESFFSPGKKAQVFGPSKIAPSICYDELFSSVIRESRKEGGELFVNLTNDGWFPFSKLSKQHFTHGLIRTVENGTPLVRSCSIGITGAVDSLGRVVASLKENERGALFVKVPKYQYTTLFSVLGQSPLLIFCGFFASIAFYFTSFLTKNPLRAF